MNNPQPNFLAANEIKIRFLRLYGLVLMALALALLAGYGVYYVLRNPADAQRIVYAPGGGITGETPDHGSAKVSIIIASVFIFMAGLVAFLVSWAGQNQKAAQEVNRPATGRNDPWRRDTASAAKELFARYRKRPPM
jgi:hypothetical protein